MKIQLIHHSGNYHNGHWENGWEREYDGNSVFACGHYNIIGGISVFRNSILVQLEDTPLRIDRDSNGSIWLLDADGISRYPQTLHLLDNETSETLFTKEVVPC